MTTDREREDRVTSLCTSCDALGAARRQQIWQGGMLVQDRWECLECGEVLWEWRYNSRAPLYDGERPRRGEQLRLF